jgi:hypothetical protein
VLLDVAVPNAGHFHALRVREIGFPPKREECLVDIQLEQAGLLEGRVVRHDVAIVGVIKTPDLRKRRQKLEDRCVLLRTRAKVEAFAVKSRLVHHLAAECEVAAQWL